MSLPVLVAVPGPDEARLVVGWEPLRRELVVVRRCADLPEVLAAARAGLGRAVVLGADLPGADAEAVDVLRRQEVGLLVLLPTGPGATALEHRWRAMGAHRFASAADDPAAVARALAVVAEAAVGPGRAHGGTAAAPGPADPATDDGDGAQEPLEVGAGRTVAVWGPHGSAGRSTVAVNLAAELAGTGAPTVLVDLDTRGACVAQLLGLLDEAPGLLAAVRAATEGRLNARALHRHTSLVLPDLAVLTGSPDPRRWSEVRPVGLRRVLEVAAGSAEWVVLDLPGGLEEEDGADRDAATAVALESADVVLVVGAADPVGLQRWIRTWQRLGEVAPGAPAVAVLTRVRASAAGSPAPRRVAAAVHRFAGVDDAVLLPEDTAADDAALAGRTLGEVAARSPLRRAVAGLAQRLEDSVAVPVLPEVPADLAAI
ncbi:AAA family ATPase [Kineococcus sp. SYSU DK018]|uniref:AAA family ATPase n=1 Tax=Kineococcus sp. SYSU DK018 TaxID=3383139 RepID=UPI003D7CFB58